MFTCLCETTSSKNHERQKSIGDRKICSRGTLHFTLLYASRRSHCSFETFSLHAFGKQEGRKRMFCDSLLVRSETAGGVLGTSPVKRKPLRLVQRLSKQRQDQARDVVNDYVLGFAQNDSFAASPVQCILQALDERLLSFVHRSWHSRIAARRLRDARRAYFATHFSEAKTRGLEEYEALAAAQTSSSSPLQRSGYHHHHRFVMPRTEEEKLKMVERSVMEELQREFDNEFSFEGERKRLAKFAKEKGLSGGTTAEGASWQGTLSSLPLKPFVLLMWDASLQTGLFDALGNFRRKLSLAERRTSLRRAASLGLMPTTSNSEGDQLAGTQRQRGRRQTTMADDMPPDIDDEDDELEKDDERFDEFASRESDLFLFLADLFKTIDNEQLGAVSWDQLITHILDTVYVPQLGASAGGGERLDSLSLTNTTAGGALLYRDSLRLNYPLYRPHWINKMNFFNGWDAIAMHDGPRVAVTSFSTLSEETGDESLLALIDHDAPDTPSLLTQTFKGSSSSGAKKGFITAEEVRVAERQEHVDSMKRLSKAAHVDDQCVYLEHGGNVTSSEYIARDRLFITAAAESKQLRMWSVHHNMKFINHVRLSYPVDCTVTAIRAEDRQVLRSDPVKLFYGTRDGHIVGDCIADDCTEYFRRMTGPYRGNHLAKLHTDAVSDMLVCPRSQLLVSGGLDGRLFMHAPFEGDPARSLTEFVGHERGILSLAYCHGYEIIISAGFEYHAMCWSENVTRAPAFILKDSLATNQTAICSVFTVPHTPHVYTVDLNAIVKLFDIRTLKTIGSWGAFDPGRVPTGIADDVSASCGKDHVGVIGSACFTGAKHRSILVAGKCLHKFQTESRGADVDRCLDMSEPIVSTVVGIRYILTASPRLLRLWRIVDGGIEVTHRTNKYSPSLVTTAQMHDTTNKIAIGHADGSVNVVQVDNGLLLHRYVWHCSPVTSLVFDNAAGLLITVTKIGECVFWRDQDTKHRGTGMVSHLLLKLGHYQRPLPGKYRRSMSALAKDEAALLAPLHSTTLQIRRSQLVHWVMHRWASLVNRNKQNRGMVDDELVRRFLGMFRMPGGVQDVAIDEVMMRLCIVSTKTTARVVSYAQMPPTSTHRLFHGKGRPLVTCAFIPKRSLCATSDSTGLVFIWVVADGRPAVLASAFANKCLVTSYSKPSDEFRDGNDSGGDEHDLDEDGHDLGMGQRSVSDSFAINDSSSTNNNKKPIPGSFDMYVEPEKPMPCVTSMSFDTTRDALVTGDDVGFVSLWELDDVLRGYCDIFDVLQLSKPSGAQAHWIFAWRAGMVPVRHAIPMPHTMASIFVQVSDNTAAIWSINGDWICSLRQGPVVNRSWHFPNELLETTALVRIRFEKLYQAAKSGRLAEVGRVDDGGKPESMMHPDLFCKLANKIQVDQSTMESTAIQRSLRRHSGKMRFLQPRFSTSLRGTSFVKQESMSAPPALAMRPSMRRPHEQDVASVTFVQSADFTAIQSGNFGERRGSDDDEESEEAEEEEEEELDGSNLKKKRGNNFGAVVDEVDALERTLAKIASQRMTAMLKALVQQPSEASRAAKLAEKLGTNSDLSKTPLGQKQLHVISKNLKTVLTTTQERSTAEELESKRLGEMVHVKDHREYVDYLRRDESEFAVSLKINGTSSGDGEGGSKRHRHTFRGDPLERYVPPDQQEVRALREILQRAYTPAKTAISSTSSPIAKGTISIDGITAKVTGSISRTPPPRPAHPVKEQEGVSGATSLSFVEPVSRSFSRTPPQRYAMLPALSSPSSKLDRSAVLDDMSSPPLDPRRLFATAVANATHRSHLQTDDVQSKLSPAGNKSPLFQNRNRHRVESLLRPITVDRAISRATVQHQQQSAGGPLLRSEGK